MSGEGMPVLLSSISLEKEVCLNRFEFAYIVYSTEMHAHGKNRSF